MHRIANPKNRRFKSDSVLQVLGYQQQIQKISLLMKPKMVSCLLCSVSSIGRARHCHCRGKGIETPTGRQVYGHDVSIT
jgi:hypothetical protein